MYDRKKNENRVYVDLEYAYPGMTRGKGRPTARDTRQIVQISAIVFNTEQGRELQALDILTFPEFDPILPDFFVELTHITQERLQGEGVSLSEGLDAFESFVGDHSIWTFHRDEEVFRQNYAYLGREFPFSTPFTRVKELLPHWDIDPDAYSSGTLYQAAGLDLQGHVHNALHDVRSMAQAVHVFESRLEA